MRLGFLAGTELRQMQTGSGGNGVATLATPPGPGGLAGSEPVAAVDPDGGGLLAYASSDALGLPAVAIRQEFASGSAQTGIVSGGSGGPIGGLAIGRSGSGDGLIAFRQGEPGRFAIVADRVSTPPTAFRLSPPKGWSRPGAVKLRWQAARSAGGGVRYTLFLNGRRVRSGLRRLRFHPRPAMLVNGVQKVQVEASDELGGQVLSNRAKLRVDGQAPTVKVTVGRARTVTVRIGDAESGLRGKDTAVRFGDGARKHGGSRFVHTYLSPANYEITVRARDRAGNRLWRNLRVRVR